MAADQGAIRHSGQATMETREHTLQHITIRTGVPFDDFVAKVEAQLGQHDDTAYAHFLTDSSQAAKVEAILASQAGSSGMLLFMIFPVGGLLALKDRPSKARQYVMGNTFAAFKVLCKDIRAGLNVPLRVLVYEDAQDNAVVEYDTPTSIFAPFQDSEIDAVAKSLDEKVARLVQTASS
jgi:uncharacterized protein (DUF302 family)